MKESLYIWYKFFLEPQKKSLTATLGCNDVNNLDRATKYDYLFVDQDTFKMYKFCVFMQLIDIFTKY
jgi:hypothetical protein